MLHPQEALASILDNVEIMDTECVSIINSQGRIIASPWLSLKDIPPRDSSAMDGYAVRYVDTKQTPVKLKVAGVIAAGDIGSYRLKEGECYKIMTGAFIPEGADTVIQYEFTDKGSGVVNIITSNPMSSHIRRAKEDIGEGDLIDLKGYCINPFTSSRLISSGCFFIDVYRKPRVAVVSTGSEVASYKDYSNKKKIIDSNAPALVQMLESYGADVSYVGVLDDDKGALIDLFKHIRGYDIVVISGGISAGDFDHVSSLSKELNFEWLFHKVNQKPGKPMAFGYFNKTAIFALPGNPVSCMFCCYYYLQPFVKKMSGCKFFHNTAVTARLGEKVIKKQGRNQFDRVKVISENGVLYAYPYISQSSNIIWSMVESNAFMELDGSIQGDLERGLEVKVYLYGDIVI